jgi:hypothetical protein
VNQVTDAAASDIIDGLRSAGRPEAARLYATADRYWRNRLATIDRALAPIIGTDGEKSGEAVVQALQRDLKGNNARFISFVNALPPEERGTVRASLISRLGQATKGNQNERGDVFSLSTFLTNWNEIGESGKVALFGTEGSAALNDLAIIARGSKEAQKFANHSNTAGAALGNLVFTGIAGGLGGLKTAGASLVAPYAMGRLLASPRFARWLARSPRTSLGGPAYIDRLSRIARAEPGIANEVLSLRDRLLQAVNDNVGHAAAASDANENQQSQAEDSFSG